jgi:hypothetical protein
MTAPLRSVPNVDEAVTGEVFGVANVPHFDQSLQYRNGMTMPARTVTVHIADIELLVVSGAESYTRVYNRISELSQINPEITAAYLRLLSTYEQRLHGALLRPIAY